MKKSKIIIIVVISILLVTLITFFIIKGIKKESRKYSIEKVENYNYFVLQEDDKYGVIDKNANVIIQPKFEEVVIPNPSKAIFVCTTDQKETKVYNENNEEKFTNYEDVTAIRLKNTVGDLMYEKSVLKYKNDGKYGLIDFEGKEITKPIYGNIEGLEYKEGELLVEQNGQYGVININGNEMVPIKYQIIQVDEYKNAGYTVAVKTQDGYRYGYIDIDGNEILETNYNEISRITEIENDDDYFIASKNGQYGVYKNSKQIINHEYQSINFDRNNKIFILEKSKKYGVANLEGKILAETIYTQIDVNGEYMYAKQKDGNTVVLDTEGKQANIDPNIIKYDVANNKYVIVIKNNEGKSLYSVQDKNGNEIIKSEYSYIGYLYENYFIVSDIEGKLGVIDDTGAEKIELKYNSVQKIEENNLLKLYSIERNMTEIYSNNMEKICEMENAIVVEMDKYIKVYNSSESIYISTEGSILENTQVFTDNKLFAIKQDDKWGFKDANGEIKVKCEYEKVTEFNKYGYAGIKKDGKWGVIDETGKIVLQPKYEINSSTEPEFLGEYYKVVYGFGEVYYSNK